MNEIQIKINYTTFIRMKTIYNLLLKGNNQRMLTLINVNISKDLTKYILFQYI